MDDPLSRLRLTPDSDLGLAGQLRAQLAILVSDGALRPGDPLPAVRTLAARLGVSVNTVRSAYDRLAAEGVVLTRHGARTTVAPFGGDAVQPASRVGSGVVGVLIGGLDPFYLQLIRGIEEAAGRAGMLALVADTQDSAERAAELTRRLAVRGIDGLIEVSVGAPAAASSSRSRASPRSSIPTVYVDQPDRGGHSLVFDAARGAEEATRHLLDHGHRQVAIIAPSASRPNVRGIVDGWRAALQARGVRPAPEHAVEVGGFTIEDGRAGLGRLMDGPGRPDAVFAASARLALGALVEARHRRLAVPGDIALAGYTDIESAQLVDPPLTMIEVPAHEAGVRAMDTLADLIAGRPVAPRRHVLGVQLVVRGSCGQH